ncbi:adipocyte enhancer-binding protein 1-like [Clavelina lepadiformis]|uniref:adipocyte enhancer-binding protein 1-like n=1 Tax=Clavelina lepadiformis TaxID=159417 RepID=UPI00404269CA
MQNLILVFCVINFVISGNANQQVCLTLTQQGDNHEPSPAQGPPGRRGPPGIPGTKGSIGPPGVQGVPGQGVCNPTEIEELRGKLQAVEDALNVIIVERREQKRHDEAASCTVGLKDGRVRDEDITASSVNGVGREAFRARLDNTFGSESNIGAWSPRDESVSHWIQIDLKVSTSLTGVITQGRPSGSPYPNFVRSYKISYGNSTSDMQTIQSGGKDLIFQGNRDVKDTKVTNIFPHAVVARYIRLIIVMHNRHPNLRLEYLTC